MDTHRRSTSDEDQQNLPCTFTWIQPPPRLRQIWAILSESILRKRRSFQEALYFSPVVAQELESLVAVWKADLVLLDTVRIGQLLEQANSSGVRVRLPLQHELKATSSSTPIRAAWQPVLRQKGPT